MSSHWIKKGKKGGDDNSSRLGIYKRDNMVCCYCNRNCVMYNERENNFHYATLDHVTPRAEISQHCKETEYKDLITDVNNLVVVCNACNCSKQKTPLLIWCKRKGYDFNKIQAEITRRINQ